MQNETVTQSHILTPGVEQSFGILSVAHELTEIIVNANSDPAADGSEWRLYDVSPAGSALIWHGALTPPFQHAQRLTPAGGISAGSRVELRGILAPGKAATSVAVTTSLIGYDPNCCDSDTGSTATSEESALLVWGVDELGDSEFLTMGYAAVGSPTQVSVVAPRDGTLKNLFVHQNGLGSGSGSIAYTVWVNGSPTALTTSLDIADSDGHDTTHEVAVSEGDLIDLEFLRSGEGIDTDPSVVTVSCLF